MLQFDWLKDLDKHQKFLQKKCKNENIFLVGGAIRDLILGLEKNFLDIDFTMSGLPTSIYNKIDKKGLSHFITEKYGTITLIPKNKKTQYELTPLRTENEYSDNRHPEKINWQSDILLDSNRRDFTINSIYYFSTDLDKRLNYSQNIKKQSIKDISTFLTSLNKHWFTFYADQNLLIVQKHEYIKNLFPNASFNLEFAIYLLDMLPEYFFSKEKSKEKNIRIIIDPHLGIQDLFQKKISSVWDPGMRFTEDALRVIRALRFVSVLNQKLKKIKPKKWEKLTLFDIDASTRLSLKKHSSLIQNIAKERIKEEISKVFITWDPFAFVSLLDELSLLQHLFPALYNTKHVEQPVRYHPFDTYTHTILSLYHLQKINTDYLTRFSVLYHDVGKVAQYQSYKDGLDRDEIREILAWPLNHRFSGPEIAKTDFWNLWFSKNEIKDIVRYIANHHVPWEILMAKEENRLKKMRKLYSEAGFQKANNLLDIAIADRLWQYNPMQNSSDITDVEDLRILLKKLEKEEGQFRPQDLEVDGKMIMEYFKIQSGPKVGELLSQALERVISDVKSRNSKEKILKYLSWCFKNMN